MKQERCYITVFLFLIFTAITNSAMAQEWSAAQKAVWSDVETYWNAFAGGDADGMLSYFHESYKGWDNDEPLPNTKANTEKGVRHFLEGNKFVMHRIDPVAIEIHGNFAFIHYYYSMTFKNAEGKEHTSKGRWTDILIKEGAKWMLIGDHGGNDSDD